MPCGIYKYENLITHQIYIGQAIDLHERYKKHKNNIADLNHNEDFYIALREYGLENFSYEVLETFDIFDQDLLNELECYYIKKYNSMRPNGYNMVPGGSNGAGIAKGKTVYQFDIYGNFINEFYSAHEASRQTGIDYSSICSCCRKEKQSAKNYQWSYNLNDPDIKDISKTIKYMNRVINQYDLLGNLLCSYSTLSEASEKTNIAKATISKVCHGKGKTAGGYIWRYSDNIFDLTSQPSYYTKAVECYDLNGNLLGEFKSMTEASKIMNISISNISEVCNNKKKSVKNLIWKFKK